MSAGWLGLLLGVGVCWAVGAYNRLVRLRAGVGQAFAALDEGLGQQLAWVQGCLPAGLGTVADAGEPAPSAGWQNLRAACDQLTQALAAARRQPLEPRAVAALTAARRGLNTAWQRVGVGDGLAVVPTDRRAEHEQLLGQILVHCETFNQAVRAYNAAIDQFPALLLARLFGFRPAEVLRPMALVD